MYMKKNICVISLLLLYMLMACSAKGRDPAKTPQQTMNEKSNSITKDDSVAAINTALDVISKLEEVINFEKRYIINGRKAIMLEMCPNKDFNYFWIQVGISTIYRFEPIYNFYVAPKTYTVYFYNPKNDSIQSLSIWRRIRKW